MIKFYKKSDNLFILGNVIIPPLLYFCSIDDNAGTVSFIPVNNNDRLPEYLGLLVSNFCDEAGDAYSSVDDIYSILTDFFVNASLLNGGTIDGYIKLGSDAPAIKMKKLSGTLATAGNSVSIAHGLTRDNILSVSIMVTSTGGYRYQPVTTTSDSSEYYYWYRIDDTYIIISTGASSTAIDSQSVEILVTYEE